jgi:hypothetical protein
MPLVLPNIEDVPSFDAMAARDSSDLSALGAPGRGVGVVSGMAVTQDTGADMKVAVAAGSVLLGGTTTAYAGAGSPFTIAAASATDRRDAIVYRVGTGVVVLTGTACGTAGWTHASPGNPPVKPMLTEATDILLAEVYVANTTVAIVTATNIVDKRMAIASSVLATQAEKQLTTTAATSVVTYTPAGAGNFKIGGYFRVVTATTVVTWTVTWTDVTGAQTLTVLSAVSEVVGSYALVDFMVNAAAGSAITVTATAGTANQVYASASIGAA